MKIIKDNNGITYKVTLVDGNGTFKYIDDKDVSELKRDDVKLE
ncbi:hypothetical protein LR69_00202 [Geobacillus sp. BCO2]|nr:hypothetical protein LR69_00202 [Geobacillus sp. BCO2]